MKKDASSNEIIEQIKKFDSVSLFDFFNLIKMYNKKSVLASFKQMFLSLDENEIEKKYFDVFLYLKIGTKLPDDDTFEKLCQKYGEEKIISFLSQIPSDAIDSLEEDTKEEKKLYEKEKETLEYDESLDGIGDQSMDSINMYLKEMGSIPLLSPEKTLELFKKYSDPNNSSYARKSAKNAITEGNLRLVISIAKHYSNATNGLSFSDLIQEADVRPSVADALER